MELVKYPKFIMLAGQRKDFARNNLVQSTGFQRPVLELDETDLVYCKGASFPGRTTPTATVSYHGMKMN